MTANRVCVIGGVDTHGRSHHAAVIDSAGRVLGSAEFEASAAGDRRLLAWMRRHGELAQIGVEGTGTYGAGLARHLLAEGVPVVEVDRPNRRLRRQRGKSDPIDAEAAARAVLAGTATVPPKDRGGIIESIRALRTARSGAVKARGAALNALKAMIVSAPAELRAALDDLHAVPLVTTCAALRPDQQRLSDPLQATKAALRSLARRIVALDAAITDGPGLRWAIFGPALVYMMSGGRGGFAYALEQFDPTVIAGDSHNYYPEITPELKKKLDDQTRAQASGRSLEQLEALRDEFLIRLIKMRTEVTGG